MSARSFTEADVLGWVVWDRSGLAKDYERSGYAEAVRMAEMWDRNYPGDAPHRVCAVVPWTQEEDE